MISPKGKGTKTLTLSNIEVAVLSDWLDNFPKVQIRRRNNLTLPEISGVIADIREKLSGDWDEEKTVTLEEI